LVSSANLTEDALLLNMELGLLIEGGKLPPQVENHFAELRSAGILRSLDLSVSGMP
jgi:phosphatidylserine/phosphatidylglycerophosphate/cardiolipin synthase-like enzyme